MITITQDNIYKSDFNIVDIRDPKYLNIIDDENLFKYLSEEVELGESVNLERIFSLIESNKERLQYLYHSCLGGYPLEPYIDEINDIPTEKTDLVKLEVNWLVDSYDDDITIVSNLHGIGLSEDVDSNTNIDDIDNDKLLPYAIEFTPLNNMKYLIVELNRNVKIINFDIKTKEHSINDIGNKSFSVFDLFYAILYEISWNGDPSQREERLSEIKESIEESEKELESGNYNDLRDASDILEEFDRNDIYLVKYKEERDRLDEDLCSDIENLEPLKNCLLEKLKIYDTIKNLSNDNDLTGYYKKLSDIEFNMQLLYGLDEDSNYHKFWETPKCTCPKIDNVVKYPNGNYIKNKNCPIHGIKKGE